MQGATPQTQPWTMQRLLTHCQPNERPPAYHLIREHQDRLEAELAVAKVEQILKAGSQQIDHHHCVVTLHPKPAYIRDPSCIGWQG